MLPSYLTLVEQDQVLCSLIQTESLKETLSPSQPRFLVKTWGEVTHPMEHASQLHDN